MLLQMFFKYCINKSVLRCIYTIYYIYENIRFSVNIKLSIVKYSLKKKRWPNTNDNLKIKNFI